MRTVSLSNLVEEVISQFIKTNPGLKATFEIEKNILVTGDYDLLKVAVEKLIANAIRCTLQTKEPTIVFGQIEDEQVYFIMDNGNGFDVHKNAPLDKPYRHLSKGQFDEELTAVRRIIIKHGGRIWGAETEDIGAVFYFSLN
ncbi:MAG: hypothetical protein DI538_14105 [Azospira oryzae]|nr:MAG: hypothetical protein DI538_14105 [Azospira oryzae]